MSELTSTMWLISGVAGTTLVKCRNSSTADGDNGSLDAKTGTAGLLAGAGLDVDPNTNPSFNALTPALKGPKPGGGGGGAEPTAEAIVNPNGGGET